MARRTRFNTDSLRNGGVLAVVAIAHLALLSSIGNMRASSGFLSSSLPPVIVELVRSAPPPPRPPLRLPRQPAGGAPPAASRMHVTPPPPVDAPPELIAPVVQAPTPQPIVGLSATVSPTVGRGGEDSGAGSGAGSGEGTGAGGGVIQPARWLRRATQSEIIEAYPRAALQGNGSGRATLLCHIRLDTRLTGCRVLAASPAGQGFNVAALRVSRNFRFQPPTLDGLPLDREEIMIEVRFDPASAD